MHSRTFAPVFALAVVAFGLTGCGEPEKLASITGRVTDINGLPVRDARVFTVDGETRTTTNGSYVLTQVREDNIAVFAEYISDTGARFRGRSVTRTVNNQVQGSVNITVGSEGSLATIRGIVRDRFGRPLASASVFAYAQGYLSSARTVTDENGVYELRDLVAGLAYTVQAGGFGFSNDETNLSVTAGSVTTRNFTLDDAGSPILPAPTNLHVITWVSPRTTRSRDEAGAYEQVRRLYDPARAQRLASRATFTGNPIEVELNWDRLQGADFYGYGIYRGTGASGTILEYDFYREPMSGTYIDGDTNLLPGTTYRYQLTALGTLFPEDPDAEGPRSSIIVADTLDDLRLGSANVAGNNVVFNWFSGSGASSYVVFVFDRFPGLGVTSILNNQSSPTSNLTLTFTNPGLVRGRTYYYLVLGLANSNRSRTISQVGQFVY